MNTSFPELTHGQLWRQYLDYVFFNSLYIFSFGIFMMILGFLIDSYSRNLRYKQYGSIMVSIGGACMIFAFSWAFGMAAS